MRLLRHIIEPKRLLLVWQTLDINRPESSEGTGKRYIVGEILVNHPHAQLRYFYHSPDFIEASGMGFNGFSVFDKEQETHDLNVMNTLQRRLPSRQRTDFNDFLRYHRLDPAGGAQMTDFALLGYTGGRLPGDNFSFVHTFEEASIPCELTIEVAGPRHYTQTLTQLDDLMDSQVRFKPEPENAYDDKAIAIELENSNLIGYVNRAQTGIFHKWLTHNRLTGFVERLDDNLIRPNTLLYVKVDEKELQR